MRAGYCALIGLSALFGCDQFATAQGPAPAPSAQRSDASYVEGETCVRTDDCPRATRCVAGTCTPTSRSYQGEVLTERGARMIAVNRFQDAADAFRAADRAYHDRQVPVPSAVTCGLARALAGLSDQSGGTEARETMARTLATCLASASPGTAAADHAVASLASLADRGLDPSSLDRPDAALMTGQDPRPTADNTHVRLTMSGNSDGSRGTFRTLTTSDVLRQSLVRCFLEWWSTSRAASDDGTLRVSYARGLDDYEVLTAPHVTVAPVEVAAVPEGGDAGAHPHWLQCAQLAVQSAAADLRWPGVQEHWSETLAISVGSN